MSRAAFIAFGSSCISKVVPLDGTDSWDVFRWHYGGWRWHDNVGAGTVEYIRTNATEIAAPMADTKIDPTPPDGKFDSYREELSKMNKQRFDACYLGKFTTTKALDEATERKGDE